MRKLLIAAVVAAVGVSGFAVFATAGTGRDHTAWTMKFVPAKKNKPTRINAVLHPLEALAWQFGRLLPNERPVPESSLWRRLRLWR